MLNYSVRYSGSIGVPVNDVRFTEFNAEEAKRRVGETLAYMHPAYYTAYLYQDLDASSIETRAAEVHHDYIATVRTYVAWTAKKEK